MADQFADRAWSGGSAKCTVMSQRPPGPSNAATAAWPSKKTLVQEIDHAFGRAFIADREAGAVGSGGEG